MTHTIAGKNPRLIISADEIAARVQGLGKELTAAYEGKNPVLVGVLKGSFIFLADLAREISCEAEIDFVEVSSYGDGMSPDGLELLLRPAIPLYGRHVILIEDILDTGITCRFLQDLFLSKNPASFALCTLVDKRQRREVPIEADYAGFTIESGFVVGYGTDYAEAGRNLPGIYVLD